MSIRRRDRESTKAKLIKAAAKIFSRDGYDAATTRQVAEQAGANEALIQRYFKGKEGLLHAVIEAFKDRDDCGGDFKYEGQSLSEAVDQLMHYHLSDLSKDAALMRLAVSRAIVDPKLRRMMEKHWMGVMIPRLSQTLRLWQSKKLVARSVNCDAAAFCILALFFELGFFTINVMRVPKKRRAPFEAGVRSFILKSLSG